MTRTAQRLLVYGAAPALLAAITWADAVTSYELSLFVFYLAPVALAAWHGGRWAGLGFAAAAAGCWYLSDRISNHPYSHPLLIYWEAFMRLVAFTALAWTLSQIRRHVQRREALLDVISHDLRSPLGALVGQAQLLGRAARNDPFTTARVRAILRSASRMESMIDDLLDSARSRSQQLHLRLEPVDLGPYFTDLLERHAAALEVARIRLALPADERLIVSVDPGRLDRIVLNVLGNALKYSPADRPVELGARSIAGWVTIWVRDEGPGIPARDLPHVFDRFYRGGKRGAAPGLGLGLFSVRLLVEAHGGTVRAEAGRGGGTTVFLKLPPAEAAPAPELAAPAPGPERKAPPG
jgi:signal transduction histidine kinase